jgi:hypothetical protein
MLEVAWGDYEVLVLDLDAPDGRGAFGLVAAIRAHAETRCLSVVGLSKNPLRRRRFVSAHGDAALARGNGSAIGSIARWLTGSADAPPRGALARADYPNRSR